LPTPSTLFPYTTLFRSRIWCDVAAFARAIYGGEPGQALDLYRGNLLEGFFISDAPEFERWLEFERAKLAGVAARTARTLKLKPRSEEHTSELQSRGHVV